MKGVAGKRACHRAIGADYPAIKTKLLDNGQSKGVTASGDHYDFDALFIRAPQCSQISFGDLKLGVEQGAVNIDGEQADGRRHHRRF